MTLRTVVLKIHLYLGLAAGLVLAVVCATGALLTFQDELTELMHPARYAASGEGPRLPLAEVVRRVQAASPADRINNVAVFTAPGRTLELAFEGGALFVDPHTGAIVERLVHAETGWNTILRLHRYLLGGDVGKLIVGISVLVFLVILVSGVWVWWPSSRRQLRARTRITTRHGWRRFNFDLHVTAGIFCAVFLFAMAFTGLMWSFKWFNAAMFAVAGDTVANAPAPPPAPRDDVEVISLDAVHAAAAAAEPSPWYRIGLPKEPGAVYPVRVLPEAAPHHYASDVLYLDPYRGEVVGRDRTEGRAGGQRLRLWFHVIHFGTIGGWPTRIIWFIAVLLGATFPFTGALIWFNRNRKRWRRRWQARLAGGEVPAAVTAATPAGAEPTQRAGGVD